MAANWAGSGFAAHRAPGGGGSCRLGGGLQRTDGLEDQSRRGIRREPRGPRGWEVFCRCFSEFGMMIIMISGFFFEDILQANELGVTKHQSIFLTPIS